MRPKKRQIENISTPEPTPDSIEADHELFLQAFAKPTQIYRYLRLRHVVLPVFLPRTLCYMKERSSVSNKKRKTFKVDSILGTVTAKHQKDQHKNKPDSLTVQFHGFFSPDVQTDADCAEVEIQMLKNGHRKRKAASSCSSQVTLGKAKLCINPGQSPSTDNGSSITHKFTPSNGNLARSACLFVKVTCPIRHSLPNGLYNGDIHCHDEPPQKRRKNGRVSYHEEEPLELGAELRVYDRNCHCLLGNGQYQIVLSDLQPQEAPPGRAASWLSVEDTQALEPLEVFDKLPTIKFSLHWDEAGSNSNHSHDAPSLRSPTHLAGTKGSKQREGGQLTPKKRLKLQYIFQYGNGELMRQQTEVREDLRCPWCSLLCPTLFGLLKHLRLTHPRFNFIYVPQQKGGMIEVTLNDLYDGSYVGNPQDIHSHIGYAFSRLGPVRRSPVTHVIVYRPKRPAPSLTEFLEPETDNTINRQIIQGHNRLYFHSVTCQPMRPQEIDLDSEDENSPPWLYQKTVMMIDEFTDVNEGEKELMKMWNVHIMKHDYIADCQIPKACFSFVEEHGREVLERRLGRNLLIHLVNLFDFSLIRPEVVQRTFAMLENLRDSMGLV